METSPAFKGKLIDRGGDRSSSVNAETQWDKVMKAANQISDPEISRLIIQLSRVRLIPNPSEQVKPERIVEQIKHRLLKIIEIELAEDGKPVAAKTIIDALVTV